MEQQANLPQQLRLSFPPDPFQQFLLVCAVMFPLVTLALMRRSSFNLPLSDDWGSVQNVAVATANGSLRFSHLFTLFNGQHRPLFPNLVAVVLTHAAQWNTRWTLVFTASLGALTSLLILYLIWRYHPRLFYPALLPVTFIVWTLLQGINWIGLVFSVWHFQAVFLLAGIAALSGPRQRPQHVLLAAMMAWCATYSAGSGFLAWPLILLVMWGLGYRQWAYIAAWLLCASICLFLYFGGAGEPGGTEDLALFERLASALAGLRPVLTWRLMTYLGSLFAPRIWTIENWSEPPGFAAPGVAGAFGLILFIVNGYLVWKRGDAARDLAIWLALAGYSLGTGLLLVLARDLPGFAIEWYVTSVRLFWIATIMLMLLLVVPGTDSRPPDQIPRFVNIFALAMLGCLYFYVSLSYIRIDERRYNQQAAAQTCVLSFPLSRDTSCLRLAGWHYPLDRRVDQLARYRLSLFAQYEPVYTKDDLFPEDFKEGSPVIVLTSSPYFNGHIQRWLLRDIPPAAQYHVAPTGEEFALARDVADPTLGDGPAIFIEETIFAVPIQPTPLPDSILINMTDQAEATGQLWVVAENDSRTPDLRTVGIVWDSWSLSYEGEVADTPLSVYGYRPLQ